MKEFDKKTLETAIIYIRRLAEGNSPLNNQPMNNDTILNNPNVIRCMYFVRDVLERLRKALLIRKSILLKIFRRKHLKNSSIRKIKLFPVS